MTEEVRNKLVSAGLNIETVLERFMNNEALLERFLKKFAQDKSYRELLTAVENQDVDAAFVAAHTLKGVSANLSLDSLHEVVSAQTEFFRSKDFEAGAEMMPAVSEVYENIVSVLGEVFGE